MICPKGGFPILRHNEVRDITADLLSEICHDVEVEPKLQPLTGERLSHRTANASNRLPCIGRRGFILQNLDIPEKGQGFSAP